MAVFKCKMCDGNLDIMDGITITKCDYCGTAQTVSFFDDRRANLYRRANQLRMGSEFDKAAGMFEVIISEYPQDAESYWGLCLCKYGIEYVDDPGTSRKVPTCHRTSYDSIQQDSNYKLAVGYAEPTIAEFYKEEAVRIDRLQRSIRSIASSEAAYDVFICYKETDEYGQRTKDSVMAQEMYDALTARGYRVFFARITLDDKLGQQYEPFIFSALHSAQVMLVLGTKPEHFNAVWVKNEWSRFLNLMRENRSKVLIPCYCNMEPYEMPSEFKYIQGQNMGEIGFVQDLVRGIEKIISPGTSYRYTAPRQSYYPENETDTEYSNRSKTVAVILAIILGSMGVHDFYLGYQKMGIIKLLISFFSCGTISWIWAIIDIVRLLTGSLKTDGEGKLLKK